MTSMLPSDWSRRGVLDDWLRAGGGRGGGPSPGSAALLLRGHARHHQQLRLRPHPVPGPGLRGGGQKIFKPPPKIYERQSENILKHTKNIWRR